MIVHKIRSKSDPIFLRKVKSADRDLDKTLNWNPLDLDNEGSNIFTQKSSKSCQRSLWMTPNWFSQHYCFAHNGVSVAIDGKTVIDDFQFTYFIAKA